MYQTVERSPHISLPRSAYHRTRLIRVGGPYPYQAWVSDTLIAIGTYGECEEALRQFRADNPIEVLS